MRGSVALAVGIVAVALLGYPLGTLAGGWPRFPTRDECVRPAVDGQPVEAVYGRFDDLAEADAYRERVVAVGFVGTEVQHDGCGRWKVVLEGVPSLEVGMELVGEAETVDLHPTLELDTDG